MGRFLVAHGKIGSNRFIGNDAFITIGFSTIHNAVPYSNVTEKKIKTLQKVLTLILMLTGGEAVLAFSPENEGEIHRCD